MSASLPIIVPAIIAVPLMSPRLFSITTPLLLLESLPRESPSLGFRFISQYSISLLPFKMVPGECPIASRLFFIIFDFTDLRFSGFQVSKVFIAQSMATSGLKMMLQQKKQMGRFRDSNQYIF